MHAFKIYDRLDFDCLTENCQGSQNYPPEIYTIQYSLYTRACTQTHYNIICIFIVKACIEKNTVLLICNYYPRVATIQGSLAF